MALEDVVTHLNKASSLLSQIGTVLDPAMVERRREQVVKRSPRPRGPLRQRLTVFEQVFDTVAMGQRRSNRIQSRTDLQILAHDEDMAVLVQVARGTFTRTEGDRHQLARLNREDLVLSGYAVSSDVHLLPRARRLLAVYWGETATPLD
jgi:hypothetical protein